jgi:hypothetical protein
MESGELLDRPVGWTDEDVCIQCQRKAADKEDGSEGVLRFEILRGTPIKKAAKQAHVTMAVARGVRQQMVRHGEIEPLRKDSNGNGDAPKRTAGAFSPHKEEIERKLKDDPTRGDGEIAQEIGVTPRTVTRARERLGLPAAPTDRERDAGLLRDLGPAATAEAFAERIGTQPAGARRRLRGLLAAGLADVETVHNGVGRRKVYTARGGTGPNPSGNHPAEGGQPPATPSR